MDDTLLDGYLAGSEHLRAVVGDMKQEDLIARPIAGKWSVLEVVCHLADTDANIAHRLKRVLAEDCPEFERVQPDRMLAALSYHSRDANEELAIIDLTRRQIARILQSLPAEARERVGVIKERGRRTVSDMLSGAVEHMKHHLKFIIEKRHALGLGDEARS
jgi:uncharacterized damage-inducible protein DinB